jgi:hypothetical protein
MLSYLLSGLEEIYGCPLCGEDEPQTNKKDVILEEKQGTNEGIVSLGILRYLLCLLYIKCFIFSL